MSYKLISIVENPKMIMGIFGDEEIILKEVEVMELKISFGCKPSAYFRFQLPTYPKTPPARWIANRFNAAIMTLDLSLISSFEVHNFSDFTKGNICFEKNGDEIVLIFQGDNCSFKIQSEFLYVYGLIGVIIDDSDKSF